MHAHFLLGENSLGNKSAVFGICIINNAGQEIKRYISQWALQTNKELRIGNDILRHKSPDDLLYAAKRLAESSLWIEICQQKQ